MENGPLYTILGIVFSTMGSSLFSETPAIKYLLLIGGLLIAGIGFIIAYKEKLSEKE